MTLSNRQYRDIMKEYDTVRSANRAIAADRLETISREIPEIIRINEKMADLTGLRVRDLLYKEDRTDAKDAGDVRFREQMEELSARKKELLVEGGYAPDWLDPIYKCPDCQDTGYIGSKKCRCFMRRITELLYDQSNLKSVLQRENFTHFRTDYYPDRMTDEGISPRDNIEQVLRTAFDFIRHFNSEEPRDRNNLLIYGNAGVGKSFLSHCIADALLKQGFSVLYLSAHRLFEILADYTFRREEAEEAVNDLIFSCDLLIIDDLGTELTNAFVNSSLFTCINERLQSGSSTIINTNLSMGQISETYSERIFSRLAQYYIPLNIIGDDIRLKSALSSLDES